MLTPLLVAAALAEEPPDLRPADVWAEAVQVHLEAWRARADHEGPDPDALAEELAALDPLRWALPSRWPAEGDLTSSFGYRESPVGRARTRFHSGIDIAARRGTAVVAPAPGVVRDVSYNGGYGRVLEIDHGYGVTTVYAHCTSILVREGQAVEEGRLVATIGSTGWSTGPHLHFEVRIDEEAVDPLDFLPRGEPREP